MVQRITVFFNVVVEIWRYPSKYIMDELQMVTKMCNIDFTWTIDHIACYKPGCCTLYFGWHTCDFSGLGIGQTFLVHCTHTNVQVELVDVHFFHWLSPHGLILIHDSCFRISGIQYANKEIIVYELQPQHHLVVSNVENFLTVFLTLQ